MRRMMQALKLTVNEAKTHTCRRRQSASIFWVTPRTLYSAKTGRAFSGTRPSKKSIRKVSRRFTSDPAVGGCCWTSETG